MRRQKKRPLIFFTIKKHSGKPEKESDFGFPEANIFSEIMPGIYVLSLYLSLFSCRSQCYTFWRKKTVYVVKRVVNSMYVNTSNIREMKIAA